MIKRSIPYDQFLAVVASCVRTLSGGCRPLAGELVETYNTTVGELLGADVFAPRFASPDRSRLVDYDNPLAHPIALRDFVARLDFVSELLRGYSRVVPSVQAVLLTCSYCRKTVLIDGFHRIVALARGGAVETRLAAFELSGSTWHPTTPDLNVVCACLNPRRR